MHPGTTAVGSPTRSLRRPFLEPPARLERGGSPMHAVVGNHNAQSALVALPQRGTVGLVGMLRCIGVGEFDLAGAQNLKPILEVRARIEALQAEAGAGIV